MVFPVWYLEINQGSQRQGRVSEIDVTPIGVMDEYLLGTQNGYT